MSLDIADIKPGRLGLSSAKEWNAFAARVNKLWNTQAGPGLKLTKGEPWLLEYDGTTDAPITTWFNNTAVRVYVWRDDAWDYGSASPPLAFFVSGSFTTFNDLTTYRLAKVVKGSTGASARATAFCNAVDFSGPTAFFSKNKNNTSQLFVGTQNQTQYHNNAGGNAHLLHWQTGALDSSFTGINCTFPITQMTGIASVAGRFLIHDYATLYSTDTAGANVITKVTAGPLQMHAILNDGVSGYLQTAYLYYGTYDSQIFPQGVRKIDANGSQNAAWDAAAATGSECGCFFGTLPNLSLWNAGDTNLYTSASLEYGSALSWNGVSFGFSGYDGGIMKLSSSGVASGTPLGIEPNYNDRAAVFCKSPAGDLWFGAAVNELRTATQTIPTSTYQLYKYNEATDTATYFSGFNGLVVDCQWFSTVGAVQQFIVVGSFTTYQGLPAERIVFIDQDGNRLADLTWP
tara:strand:+ start:3474 stop:4850 length:1377 start_codon:yes stop_codon:yes gene_type:complete